MDTIQSKRVMATELPAPVQALVLNLRAEEAAARAANARAEALALALAEYCPVKVGDTVRSEAQRPYKVTSIKADCDKNGGVFFKLEAMPFKDNSTELRRIGKQIFYVVVKEEPIRYVSDPDGQVFRVLPV